MESEAKTISARLRNPELWELFHREETEMIISKAGRYVVPLGLYFRINPKTFSRFRKKPGQL